MVTIDGGVESQGRIADSQFYARTDSQSGSMDREEPYMGVGGCEEIALWTSSRACFSIGQSSSLAAASRRSLRRKRDGKEAGGRSPARTTGSVVVNEFGVDIAVARVEIGSEATALRESLLSHQQTIQKLQTELEEERSAAASAATEAMSMIVRLQNEKAEAQMEVRQFRSLTDEKMAHDQQEIATLEDLLFKREQAVQALNCEVQSYRHRLLSIGVCIDGDVLAPPCDSPLTPDPAMPVRVVPQLELPYDYPPLRCAGDVVPELDKYPPVETPRKLETRTSHHDAITSGVFCNVMEKAIVVGQSPHALPKHVRDFSYGSYGSALDSSVDDEFPAETNRALDYDDMNDRVCTVDAVHGASEDYVSTPRELQNYRRFPAVGADSVEIRKLYLWLQALEADRESMRQTLISMGTDKAQMSLMKEIAQQTFKEASSESKKIVKKPSRRFSFMFIIKTIFSFLFWRKKPDRVKYTFGLSPANAGLLLLLEKYPRLRYRSLLTRTLGGGGGGGAFCGCSGE